MLHYDGSLRHSVDRGRDQQPFTAQKWKPALNRTALTPYSSRLCTNNQGGHHRTIYCMFLTGGAVRIDVLLRQRRGGPLHRCHVRLPTADPRRRRRRRRATRVPRDLRKMGPGRGQHHGWSVPQVRITSSHKKLDVVHTTKSGFSRDSISAGPIRGASNVTQIVLVDKMHTTLGVHLYINPFPGPSLDELDTPIHLNTPRNTSKRFFVHSSHA